MLHLNCATSITGQDARRRLRVFALNYLVELLGVLRNMAIQKDANGDEGKCTWCFIILLDTSRRCRAETCDLKERNL